MQIIHTWGLIPVAKMLTKNTFCCIICSHQTVVVIPSETYLAFRIVPFGLTARVKTFIVPTSLREPMC